jgi:acyl carrier protein
LDNDCIIPEAGILDSSAIIQLVVWLEGHFGIEVPQDEVTLDNLGSINLMVDYIIKKKGL